ncbi:MAG: outer membrane protein insertion porin family [Planctomycetota bacterium]|jgi:outer membrane protein insertion porin family
MLTILVLSTGLTLQAQDDGPEQHEGMTVVDMEFIGAELANKESVFARMKTKVGQPLIREDLNADLKVLVQELKLFSTISERVLVKTNGVKIQFFVSENPRIGSLFFLGNLELNREELESIVDSHDGGLADDLTLKLDEQRLREKYLRDGFHFVQVKYRKVVEEFTTVIFDITEGPKVTIEKVTFIGNKTFEKSELLEAMPTTDEAAFLSSQPYVEKEVQADIVNLNNFYSGYGFLDAQITLVDRSFSLDKEEVFLTVKIVENEPYIVRSITFEGLDRVDLAVLQAEMKTKVGGRYEQAFALNKDQNLIRALYHDQAYINVRVRNASEIPLEGHEIDVKIVIDERQRVRVGEVRIKRNVETQDRVIRRLLDDLVPGAPFNLNTFNRAQNRIINLRYFEPSSVNLIKTDITLADFDDYRQVFITVEDTEKENIKDIEIQLEEIDTGSIRFAVGVNSNAGLVGAIVYRKENFDPLDFPENLGDFFDAFTGGGQSLELGIYPGINLFQLQATYTHPFIFDSEYDMSINAFRRLRRFRNWDETRTGFTFAVGRRIGFQISAALRYRFEFVDVDNLDDDAPQIAYDFEGERLISSMTLTVRIADLNNFQRPSDGYRIDLSHEFAGLGGEVNYNKFNFNGEYYQTLHTDADDRKHVFYFVGHFGYVKEWGSTNNVPVYERFYAGGQGSVRGFQFRGLGPTERGEPTGGKVLVTGSLNYLFPLYEKVLGGVLFVDTGSLAPELDSDALYDFRVTVGFGIRLKIDFLGPVPFAIDFGFPLSKEDGDRTQVVSFSLDRKF